MIVPEHWAEGRVSDRVRGRQVTVRRFGWSNDSVEDAQRNAETRAREAFERIIAGERLLRRELKVPYNGAEGVPIREEVIERRDSDVVSRNAYGALCLNTPDVLFADIDFNSGASCSLTFMVAVALLLGAVSLGWWQQSWMWGIAAVVAAWLLALPAADALFRAKSRLSGGEERLARGRINAYLAAHPECHFRIYRTPAGMRLTAMHRTFDPAEPAVAELFHAIGTDRIYRRMCLKQQCFRARVSPKPWRIGIGHHMPPRPGVWPIRPERMPDRLQWIADYDRLRQKFAACRFIEAIGSHTVDSRASEVQQWHDELCRACDELPIA